MAQELRWRNLTTGIFFLIGIAILATGLLIVGTNQNIFASKYTLVTYLVDTQSLAEGTGVTLAGIEIGVIKKIELATVNGENRVKLDLLLKREFQPRITTSSHGVVKSIGVLGDKFLEISQGKAGESPLQDGAVIETEPAIDWERVARDLSTDLMDVLDRVQVVIGRTERGEGTLGLLLADSSMAVQLRGSLDRLDNTLVAVERGRGSLGRLIHDPALYANLERTTRALDQFTAKLNSNEGSLGKLMNDPDLYDHAENAAANTDSITSRVLAGRGTLGKAVTDDRVYNELHRSIQDVRLLLIDMQKNPNRYVHFSVF
jgi:phospholipid/cholesterol/gamma-HCH transport system substrate-binding protein